MSYNHLIFDFSVNKSTQLLRNLRKFSIGLLRPKDVYTYILS